MQALWVCFIKNPSRFTWNKGDHLNFEFHHYLENSCGYDGINQSPYAEQALMLELLGKNGIINLDNMIDYAGAMER